MKRCLHCKRNKATKPRGLCFGCYESPVRYIYPIISKFGQAGYYPCRADPKPPRIVPKPTEYAPGTREKVAVLCQRIAEGEILWHPQDAGEDGQGTRPDFSEIPHTGVHVMPPAKPKRVFRMLRNFTLFYAIVGDHCSLFSG